MQRLPASLLSGLLDTVLQDASQRQMLFERVNLDPTLADHNDRYISLVQLDGLLVAAQAMATDSDWGLKVGQTNDPANLGLLGWLLASAPSLRRCIECVMMFKDLLVPYLHFELCEDDALARLRVLPDDSLTFTRSRLHNEVVLASMVTVARRLTDDSLGLLSVGFRHAPPVAADLDGYRLFFDTSLRFSHVVNELVFKRSVLDAALPGAKPGYHYRCCRYAEHRLQCLQKAQGVAGQVRRQLQPCLHDKQASSVETVAASLCMTQRTLQRRLREEGVTFAQVRDRLRHQQACAALRHARCDIASLATQLGFSEIANFYHAFRRWQGVSPGYFRDQTCRE